MTEFILGLLCGIFAGALFWNKPFRDKTLQGVKKTMSKKTPKDNIKDEK